MPKKRDGTTGAPSKMKEAWEARALLDKYGFTSVKEMEAALTAPIAEPDEIEIPAPATTTGETAGDRLKKVIGGDDPLVVKDDLAWITKDTMSVDLVSRNITLSLRPGRPGLNPPLIPMQVASFAEGAWDEMPFEIRSRDHYRETLNRGMYATWGYFRISRDVAEEVYGDERYPLPTKAVISGAEFRGFDGVAQRARGTYHDLKEPDALREVVRRILQRKRGSTFVRARFHPELPDPRIVNPYGNFLGSLSAKLPKVVTSGESIL